MPDKQGRYKPGVPTQINSMKNVEPFGEFRWVPAGEGCVRTSTPGVWYYRARRHPEGLEWQVNPQQNKNRSWTVNGVGDRQWTDGAKEALDHFWPLMKSEAPKDDPIAWQFKTTPDKVDIARCLREAYDAGAREVTIVKDGVERFYLHQEVRFLVKSWFFQTQSMRTINTGPNTWPDLCLTQVDQWTMMREPLLERARAWDAEQKAKAETKVVVKVKGIR